jgi:hypothetical protein
MTTDKSNTPFRYSRKFRALLGARCKATTSKGRRCSQRTTDVRDWRGTLYPCCKNHPQWWWELNTPHRSNLPNNALCVEKGEARG